MTKADKREFRMFSILMGIISTGVPPVGILATIMATAYSWGIGKDAVKEGWMRKHQKEITKETWGMTRMLATCTLLGTLSGVGVDGFSGKLSGWSLLCNRTGWAYIEQTQAPSR